MCEVGSAVRTDERDGPFEMSVEKPSTTLTLPIARKLLFGSAALAGLLLAASKLFIQHFSNYEAHASRTLFVNLGAVAIYFWISVGSALGGMARYWCSGAVARLFGETFPWGTLFINILGSFVIGFFATLTGPDGRILVSSTVRQFVMVGICGGYTTFSSFSLQTLNLVNGGEWLSAAANVWLSLTLCLTAVWIGHVIAVGFNGARWYW